MPPWGGKKAGADGRNTGEESSNIGCGMPTKHLLREWVMATEGDGGTKRSSDGREGTVVETKGSC